MLKKGRISHAVSVVRSEIVDHETGEVSTTNTTTSTARETEPSFVKMYIDDVGKLMDLRPACSNVLHLLVKSMSYYNIVTMLKPVKEMMCEELGMTMGSLNNEVDRLYKKGILIRKARSVYLVDPEMFGKGRWENVKKIRMIVEYDEKGNKTINTELVKQLELEF